MSGEQQPLEIADAHARVAGAPLPLTRLRPPQLRSGLVARRALFARLDEALRVPLTTLIAPAGSGKTTLAGAWLTERQQPFAWVSLDASDNDPPRFWRTIFTALDAAYPGVASAALAPLTSAQPAHIEATLTLLLNALAASPIPMLLALDDYHAITAQAIHDGVAYLIEALPPQAHLLLASRATPPLPLARLRVRGLLVELDARDLVFDAGETRAFLNESMGLRLSSAQIEALRARTEGWVAGLQLAALSLRERTDPQPFLDAFGGDHAALVEYLGGEVVERQSPETQRFLFASALLERFSAPLCDAVLERDDSAARLDALERERLFLVALDERRRWYRFHALFGDFLRLQAETRWPERARAWRRRAADWFERRAEPAQAIPFALAACEYEHAARLIEAVAQQTLERGELATLLGWLQRLPDACVRERPRLGIAYAAVLTTMGAFREAEEWLRAAERVASATSVSSETRQDGLLGTAGEILGGRAVIAAYQGALDVAITLSRQALDLLPAEAAFQRIVITAALAAAYWWSGDFLAAGAAFAEATALAGGGNAPHIALSCLAGQGMTDIAHGKLTRAAATFAEVIRLAQLETGDPAHPLPAASLAYVGASLVAYERDALDEAERAALDGLALEGASNDTNALVSASYLLALIRQARCDAPGAAAALTTLDRVIRERNATHLVPYAGALWAQHWLAAGRIEAAARWAETQDVYAPDGLIPYLREQELYILAQVWIAQRRYGEALDLLRRLLRSAGQQRLAGQALRRGVLLALAHDGLGERDEALDALAQTLPLAAAEGYRRAYIEQGAQMGALLFHLREAARTGERVPLPPAALAHLDALLAALPLADPATRRPDGENSPLDKNSPLNEREREVLRLTADGLSTDAVARRLFLAPSTVKWYLKHIYAKLDAHSRTQAVAHARALKLLP